LKIGVCGRVLSARYREVGGTIAEEGRFNSVWWNNLINVKNGVGVGSGSWFDDNVGREVGDGAQTLFWWDPWIDDLVLKNSFSRLFDLATHKVTTTAEMYSFGWGLRVKLGSGGVVCWLGRKRESENVVIFYLILFCSLLTLTGGFGTCMPPTIIQSQVLIIIS